MPPSIANVDNSSSVSLNEKVDPDSDESSNLSQASNSEYSSDSESDSSSTSLDSQDSMNHITIPRSKVKLLSTKSKTNRSLLTPTQNLTLNSESQHKFLFSSEANQNNDNSNSNPNSDTETLTQENAIISRFNYNTQLSKIIDDQNQVDADVNNTANTSIRGAKIDPSQVVKDKESASENELVKGSTANYDDDDDDDIDDDPDSHHGESDDSNSNKSNSSGKGSNPRSSSETYQVSNRGPQRRSKQQSQGSKLTLPKILFIICATGTVISGILFLIFILPKLLDNKTRPQKPRPDQQNNINNADSDQISEIQNDQKQNQQGIYQDNKKILQPKRKPNGNGSNRLDRPMAISSEADRKREDEIIATVSEKKSPNSKTKPKPSSSKAKAKAKGSSKTKPSSSKASSEKAKPKKETGPGDDNDDNENEDEKEILMDDEEEEEEISPIKSPSTKSKAKPKPKKDDDEEVDEPKTPGTPKSLRKYSGPYLTTNQDGSEGDPSHIPYAQYAPQYEGVYNREFKQEEYDVNYYLKESGSGANLKPEDLPKGYTTLLGYEEALVGFARILKRSPSSSMLNTVYSSVQQTEGVDGSGSIYQNILLDKLKKRAEGPSGGPASEEKPWQGASNKPFGSSDRLGAAKELRKFVNRYVDRIKRNKSRFYAGSIISDSLSERGGKNGNLGNFDITKWIYTQNEQKAMNEIMYTVGVIQDAMVGEDGVEPKSDGTSISKKQQYRNLGSSQLYFRHGLRKARKGDNDLKDGRFSAANAIPSGSSSSQSYSSNSGIRGLRYITVNGGTEKDNAKISKDISKLNSENINVQYLGSELAVFGDYHGNVNDLVEGLERTGWFQEKAVAVGELKGSSSRSPGSGESNLNGKTSKSQQSLTEVIVYTSYKMPNNNTQNAKKFRKTVKRIFLGDYVDRGVQNTETLTLLNMIRIIDDLETGGNNLIMLRGNHEVSSHSIIKPYAPNLGMETFIRYGANDGSDRKTGSTSSKNQMNQIYINKKRVQEFLASATEYFSVLDIVAVSGQNPLDENDCYTNDRMKIRSIYNRGSSSGLEDYDGDGDDTTRLASYVSGKCQFFSHASLAINANIDDYGPKPTKTPLNFFSLESLNKDASITTDNAGIFSGRTLSELFVGSQFIGLKSDRTVYSIENGALGRRHTIAAGKVLNQGTVYEKKVKQLKNPEKLKSDNALTRLSADYEYGLSDFKKHPHWRDNAHLAMQLTHNDPVNGSPDNNGDFLYQTRHRGRPGLFKTWYEGIMGIQTGKTGQNDVSFNPGLGFGGEIETSFRGHEPLACAKSIKKGSDWQCDPDPNSRWRGLNSFRDHQRTFTVFSANNYFFDESGKGKRNDGVWIIQQPRMVILNLGMKVRTPGGGGAGSTSKALKKLQNLSDSLISHVRVGHTVYMNSNYGKSESDKESNPSTSISEIDPNHELDPHTGQIEVQQQRWYNNKQEYNLNPQYVIQSTGPNPTYMEKGRDNNTHYRIYDVHKMCMVLTHKQATSSARSGTSVKKKFKKDYTQNQGKLVDTFAYSIKIGGIIDKDDDNRGNAQKNVYQNERVYRKIGNKNLESEYNDFLQGEKWVMAVGR